MTPQKIIATIEQYEQELAALGVPRKRMDPNRTFASLSREEMLMHAHYLCSGVKEYALDLQKQRKAGSHLTSVQLCMSFAGLYTLQELMDHTRS